MERTKSLDIGIHIIFMFIFVSLVAIFLLSSPIRAVSPSGANVSELNSQSAQSSDPQGLTAQAGNVTEMNIFGYTTTQSWQGYYGNVTGTIQLGDGNDNIMYNWTLASPEGEIYASTNDSIQWGYIHCFNFTATGTYDDDSANVGNYSLYGTNLTQLEYEYNISWDDVDGVDETFSLNGTGTHNRFFTANHEFPEGECQNTRIYSDLGKGEDDKFEEVLLYDSQRRAVVFASILNEDIAGFNQRTHDFEMLVLEDGHGADTSPTNYYFYVELQ